MLHKGMSVRRRRNKRRRRGVRTNLATATAEMTTARLATQRGRIPGTYTQCRLPAAARVERRAGTGLNASVRGANKVCM